MNKALIICCFFVSISCGQIQNKQNSGPVAVIKPGPPIDSGDALSINTHDTKPQELIAYAETLLGTPYKYASTDPEQGFDCSGFITYVFDHFDIGVPRSSVEFTNVPHEVLLADAKPGDLILFTGTDSTVRIVGHMGIIVSHSNNEILFIHSSSGKASGVTITPVNDYYMGRFMKLIRVFPENNSN